MARATHRRRPPRYRARARVADAWKAWIAENLLRGVTQQDLLEALTSNDVPPRLALATIAAVRSSPGLAQARKQRRRADQNAMTLRLVAAVRPAASVIERIPHPDAETFFKAYWETSTPVIFTDIVPSWPAFKDKRWSLDALRERFGTVEVDACTGRDGAPHPDENWEAHRVTLSLGEYIDRVVAAGTTNDLYLIANNRNTARRELRALWDDVKLPPGWFSTSRLAHGSALWVGPAGTVTPLHHDTSNILFCQVVGRKRIALAAPWDPVFAAQTRGLYSGLSWEAARDRASLVELDLAPGEALFIPVGWWHALEALDPSVSLAVNAFSRHNSFPWYVPGAVR